MAYWFGRFSLVGFCFIKLLCWNVCWLLGAGFLAFLQPVLRFMVPMGAIWHAWCLYFGVLEDPGTILGRSRDIGGHWEGPFEVQAWILSIFSCKLFGYFWTKQKQFFISISRLLFLLVFGSKLGCLGLEKHGFGMGLIAKINFCRNWISHDSRVDFSWF